MIKLCKNLKLNIELDENSMGEEHVMIKLEDPIQFKEVEICYSVNVTGQQSHRYHVKEALVIGLRQVVDQAVTKGLIDLTLSKPPGAPTNSKSTNTGVEFHTGFMTELDA